MTVGQTAAPALSRRACQGEAARRLEMCGIETPALDARLLLAAAMNATPESLWLERERPLTPDEIQSFETLIARRCAREPLAYILGRREFWSLPIRVGPEVLIPRPDSEALIEAVLGEIVDRRAPLRVLDLGTGSGCLLAALLTELPNAEGLGVDRSAPALALARRTFGDLGLSARAVFLCGNWTDAALGLFDVVISNPPYIPAGEIAALAPEVARHEPFAALSGGRDGLDAYRALLPAIATHLAPGGLAAVEFGEGQRDIVAALATGTGLVPQKIFVDLSRRPRGLLAKMAESRPQAVSKKQLE